MKKLILLITLSAFLFANQNNDIDLKMDNDTGANHNMVISSEVVSILSKKLAVTTNSDVRQKILQVMLCFDNASLSGDEMETNNCFKEKYSLLGE